MRNISDLTSIIPSAQMIKKFFISMLGSLAAIWISIFVLVIGSIFTVAILIGKSADTKSLTEDKILHINLSGDIPERAEATNYQDLILSGQTSTPETLEDILAAIYSATSDKKIKMLYLDCRGASAGIASREEIIEAIKYFRTSGKPVYAYADNYEQGDYFLASQADKIYLNPIGGINLHGLSSMVMFYTDLLKKLGIEMQIYKVGAFKSAVEPFMLTKMSEPSRLQTQVFLNQIWDSMVQTMSNDSLSTATIRSLSDSVALFLPGERFVTDKVVTALKYRFEVEDEMRSFLSLKDDDDLPFISPSKYLLSADISKTAHEKDHIAVLYAVGDIVDSGKGGIVGEKMVPEILALARDKKVKGLVLRVNSGGGSAFASEQIWEALEQFKASGKPFYVSMGDYAASGGYYISCGADSIFADKATLTGSIGIFGMFPCAQELVTEKIGVKVDTVSTSANSFFPSLLFPADAFQASTMQNYVERGYDLFTSRVAKGRDIPQDSVKAIGGGRVWDGMTALNIGLVDKISPLKYVIEAMAKKVDLKPEQYISYPKIEDDIWATLIEMSSMHAEIDINGLGQEEALQYLRAVRSMKTWSPLQARMETIVLK